MSSVDFSKITEQFRDLSGRPPGLWPIFPRLVLLLGAFLGTFFVIYFGYLRGSRNELAEVLEKEIALKGEFTDKANQAAGLDILRQQKKQVLADIDKLEKQLPGKSEMDALLSDINRAGIGRSLAFELFKPGQVVLREGYAELPINLRLVGSYHDLGAFAIDIANLSRIVTLGNLVIAPAKKEQVLGNGQSAEGLLSMDAVAKTYRYLDSDERRQLEAIAKNPKPSS